MKRIYVRFTLEYFYKERVPTKIVIHESYLPASFTTIKISHVILKYTISTFQYDTVFVYLVYISGAIIFCKTMYFIHLIDFTDYKFLKSMEYQFQMSKPMLILQCQLLFYQEIQYQSVVLCMRTK